MSFESMFRAQEEHFNCHYFNWECHRMIDIDLIMLQFQYPEAFFSLHESRSLFCFIWNEWVKKSYHFESSWISCNMNELLSVFFFSFHFFAFVFSCSFTCFFTYSIRDASWNAYAAIRKQMVANCLELNCFVFFFCLFRFSSFNNIFASNTIRQ